MKTYDELKTKKEAIEKRMSEIKKRGCTDALKSVKEFCKELGFTAWMLKDSLVEGIKKK